MERRIQSLRRCEVAAEWFFHDDARAICTSGSRQPCCDGFKHAGRNCQIVEGMLCIGQHASKVDIGGVSAVIAVDVLQAGHEAGKCIRLEPSVLLEAFLHACLQLIEAPSGPGHDDHRHIQVTSARQRLKGREDLFECQVARRSKKYQCVRLRYG